MLQRIFVATDFSPAARRAVARAAQLARETGAQLTMLHALPERDGRERQLRRGAAESSELPQHMRRISW